MNGQEQHGKYISRYRRQLRREMDAMDYPGSESGEPMNHNPADRGRRTQAWRLTWAPANELGPFMKWAN